MQIPYQRGTQHCEEWHRPKPQHFAGYCAKQRPRPSKLHTSVCTVCTAHCAPKSFTDDVFDTLHRSQGAASAVHCYRGQTWFNHATPMHGVTSQEIQSNAISKQHHSDCLWDHKVCFFWISWTVATLYSCWALLFCARRVTARHLSHTWTTAPRRHHYSR